MSSNFTPEYKPYSPPAPFRFWCQTVLPSVYDDSLSYYELLNRVVNYLNDMSAGLGTIEENVSGLYTAYNQLQEYVNTYFDNLDVQTEINNKLDEMAENGALTLLMQPFISENVTQWLDDNITTTTPIVDESLTISGAAADAKVTGEGINSKVSKTGYKEIFGDNLVFTVRGKNLYSGAPLVVGRIIAPSTDRPDPANKGEVRSTSTAYKTTPFIYIADVEGTYLIPQRSNAISSMSYAFYDENYDYISGWEEALTEALLIPEGAVYVRVSYLEAATENQVMISRSNSPTAIPYERPTFTIPNKFIDRNFISSIPLPQFGEELNDSITGWSGSGGTTWNPEKSQYEIPIGGAISKPFDVNTVLYKIELTMSNDPRPFTPTITRDSRLLISLGDDSVEIFAANDGTFQVVLSPSVGGTQSCIISSAENWTGAIKGVSIKEVIASPTAAIMFNNLPVYDNSSNTGIGSGMTKIASIQALANVAFGYHALDDINTGRYNTGIGWGAQRHLTVGSSNTAVGSHTQENATTAMYNVAIGGHAQRLLTSGCWNVAVGIEGQHDITTGSNNVALGRRAQNQITTGQRNIAIGALAGFISTNRSQVETATKTEVNQILIGFMSTQLHSGSNDGIAIGAFAGCGENGIAIGTHAEAGDNEITIGNSEHSVVRIAGKLLHFNNDGSVTWAPANE